MMATAMVKSSPMPGAVRPRTQDVDRHVGARIRERRVQLGLTQHQIAELTGVTYQQAHKYEKGINRVAAGRLYTIARALGVEIGYFFEGLQTGGSVASPRRRMLLELARNFLSIADPGHREAVAALARALAGGEGDPRAARAPAPDSAPDGFGDPTGPATGGSQGPPAD